MRFCEYREIFLEKYFEEGIAKGMSEEEARICTKMCRRNGVNGLLTVTALFVSYTYE